MSRHQEFEGVFTVVEHDGPVENRRMYRRKITVAIRIDEDQLFETLGKKAFLNHSKKARAQFGAIVAKIKSVSSEDITRTDKT